MNYNAKPPTKDQISRWNFAFEKAVAKVGLGEASKITNMVIMTYEADGELDWEPHYNIGIEKLWALTGEMQMNAADEYEEILAVQDLMNVR